MRTFIGNLVHAQSVEPALRLFFCLPFVHSEDMFDQELCFGLHRKLGRPWLSHAERHRDIIRRFGRFPPRNAMFAGIRPRRKLCFWRMAVFVLRRLFLGLGLILIQSSLTPLSINGERAISG